MRINKKILFINLILIILILAGCGKNDDTPDFAEAGILVKLSSTPKDIEEEQFTYTTNIEVYNDGTIKIYADGFSKWYGEEEPEVEKLKIAVEDIEAIKSIILEEDLYHQNENVGNKDNIAGVEKRLTIYTVEGEYSIHGISPSNVKFNKVYDYIYGLKRDELTSYIINVNEIQKKGSTNDIGISILDGNGKVLFEKSDIESISLQKMETVKNDGEDDEENKDSTEISLSEYKILIELKDDKYEKMYELTKDADSKNYIIFNLYVDNVLYMILYTDVPIEDGKIYSNNNYTEEDAKAVSDELKSELE